MTDKSKIRMNLVAIKKVDPYARDIVDSSSHVAFYTFNSEKNEWEKTDVEGAFFIYSRNAQPFHSIFINNRLNTTSFVEPITGQLEMQSQPPFLLYRNERSRIRGFWFYNSNECDRISNLVTSLVQQTGPQPLPEPSLSMRPVQLKQENINLFKMLSEAQQQYNNAQTRSSANFSDAPNNNVLEFFAAAKPATAETNFQQRLLPNTLSVEQIEKQQRTKSNDDEKILPSLSKQFFNSSNMPAGPDTLMKVDYSSNANDLAKFLNCVDMKNKLDVRKPPINKMNDTEANLTNLLAAETPSTRTPSESTKPALMPPTMFEKPIGHNAANNSNNIFFRQEPLNASQLVQAFNYLMQNDEEFVQKLHEAYLKVFSKPIGTYQ